MSIITRIYFDFLTNIFLYLLICKLTEFRLNKKISTSVHVYCILLYIIYAIPETLPFQNIISNVFSALIIFIVSYPRWKDFFILFIEFKLLTTIGHFTIQLIHTLLTLDLVTIVDNPYYADCKMTICTALLYIIYILYHNAKRMKQLHSHYQHIFTIVILSISFILSHLTLFICQTQIFESPVIPVLLSSLFILIVLCIHIYKRYIDLIEENIASQFLIEQSIMTANFSNQIENNLKELHSLRHDIRNHLITIDGYAAQERYDSIHQYIGNITNQYTDTPLFDTSSDSVSALLNAKYQLACQKDINFTIEYDFPFIHNEDFHIITILGNIIDNAITASEKCENPHISLTMLQQDSYLDIHIQNNHIENIQENNGLFKSTKENSNHIHGLGIKNVRSTVKQLNGQLDITYTENTFNVNILIPNY